MIGPGAEWLRLSAIAEHVAAARHIRRDEARALVFNELAANRAVARGDTHAPEIFGVPDYQKFRAGSRVGEPLLSTSHEVEVPAALFVGSASYSWGEDELTTPDATISNARARLSDFKHLAGSDTALRTGVTVAQDSEHNKGGRPPLDADDFWIEIVRLANLPDGLPDQHELVPHMLEFSPDRSENWVRGKLRKLYRRVQKP